MKLHQRENRKSYGASTLLVFVLLARDRLLIQCPELRELHCPLASQFLKYSHRAEPRVPWIALLGLGVVKPSTLSKNDCN